MRTLLRLSLAVACATLLAVSAGAATLHPDDEITEPAPLAEARFGSALATGDVNGDGIDDAIVGSTGINTGLALHGGEVNVFLGPTFSHSTTLYSPSSAPRFGEAVAAGDVNGDGFDEVIVSSRYAHVGQQMNAGEVFVFFGPSLTSSQTLYDPMPQASAAFGISVAAGDTNDDGRDEVIVGAWDSNHSGFTKAGEAFVFQAPALSTVTTLRSPNPQNVADFGVTTAIADFDGDAMGDAIVGSWLADTNAADRGHVFVFHGPSFTTVTPLDPPPLSASRMGRSLAAGDIDGDGDAEVVAGATGTAIVFDSTGPGAYTHTVLSVPWGSLAITGVSVADATGDGKAEIALGVPDRAYGGGNKIGSALLYIGDAQSGAYTLQMPTAATAEFGWRVAVVDGQVLVAAPSRAIDALSNAGRVFTMAIEDADADGWLGLDDNCPNVANATQQNSDDDVVDLGPPKTFDDLTWPNSDGIGDACDSDSDNDGLADAEELAMPTAACPSSSGPTQPLIRDTDSDGALDGAECLLGTDPGSATSKPPHPAPGDTDRDGLPDAVEAVIGSNPAVSDTDGDRISDGIEVRGYNSSPLSADTDADECPDGREIASVNADRTVNSIDLSQVAQAFGLPGSAGYVAHFDINRDGRVSAIDLSVVAQQFGAC